MSNIYKIKDDEIKDFIGFNNTNKVILFYKQNCIFCKLEIKDLNDLANIYKNNIEYAICDITGKTKFCLNNNIIKLPTLHIYKNNELCKQIDAYQNYEVLQNELSQI